MPHLITLCKIACALLIISLGQSFKCLGLPGFRAGPSLVIDCILVNHHREGLEEERRRGRGGRKGEGEEEILRVKFKVLGCFLLQIL